MKIWILTRLAYEGYGILAGSQHFQVQLVNNPKSPYNGTVPISPILDHQLDYLGIEEMSKLKTNVLRCLKAKLTKRKQIQWYEEFLTFFVLLHNLEYVYGKQYQYMKRHESTVGGKHINFCSHIKSLLYRRQQRETEVFHTSLMRGWRSGEEQRGCSSPISE